MIAYYESCLKSLLRVKRHEIDEIENIMKVIEWLTDWLNKWMSEWMNEWTN